MKEDKDDDRPVTHQEQTVPHVGTTPGSHNREAPSGSGRLEVRCPNCHAPTEVAADTTLTDLTCSACGSHFSLVDQSKATRMAPSLTSMGRFDLIERLGVGGFGSVWKARDKELDRTVAIKIPRAGGMTGEEQEKFFREARAAAQLRHPKIVSVHEVGRDGDSVYIVSDFVRGVTLGDWLTGQKLTSREAAELCAQIADALHHAHEQGVVHRDLKPANIIMDYDGQPHLMDFGLARRETGEISVTMDGQILGTPAYMSPEQAQGEAHTADRRSDVYSLGVILFQLLTGELPFRGNARMLIKQVIQDEPPNPRKLNANVSKDLETITLKCLEKDPARRYQTAQEFENEIGRFLSGEPIRSRPIGRFARSWRWAKRNPRVAMLTASVAFLLMAVATLSLVGFAVAKKQQLAAQQSADREANLRTLAEENLNLAEKAVDGYLTRVAEDERLKQDDFHALRTELLATAVPFYERFAKQKPGDAKSQANQANAYARLASIHGESGQHQQSVSEYQQAIELRKELASKFPNVWDYQRDLAHDEAELGWDFHVVAKTAEARPHYDSALAIITKLVNEFPKEPSYRQMLAKTHEKFGMLLRYTDAAEGQKHFERAIEIERSLVKDFPEVTDYKSGLASSCFYIGNLLTKSQLLGKTQPKMAQDYLNQAVEIQRKLSAQNPKNPEYRAALAESVTNLGAVLDSLGDTAGVRRHYEEGIDIQKQLVAQFPSVVKYRLVIGNMFGGYGKLLSTNGDSAGGLENYQQSIAVYEKLAADFPEVPSYASHACADHMTCAKLLQTMGKQSEAEMHFQRALQIPEQLVRQHPEVVSYRLDLADQHVRAAQRLLKRNETTAAVAHYEQTIAIREKLVADFPDNAKYRSELPSSLDSVANLLATSSKRQMRNGKRAVELATKACELTNYQDPGYIDTLALALTELGQLESARKLFEKTLAARQKLVNDAPTDPALRSKLANGFARFSNWFERQNDWVAALKQRQQGLAVIEKLISDFPKVPNYRADAEYQHEELARLFVHQKDFAAARKHHELRVALAEKAAADFADEPNVRAKLQQELISVAWQFATSSNKELRDVKRAIELATKGCELTHYQSPYSIDILVFAYTESGQLDSARTLVEKSLAASQKLVDASPTDPALRSNMANAFARLSNVLEKQNDWDAALKLRQQSLTVVEKLISDFPKAPGYRADAQYQHEELARLFAHQNDFATARKHHEQRVATAEKAVADFPNQSEVRTRQLQQLCAVASLFATSTDKPMRDVTRAIELATKACEQTEYKGAGQINLRDAILSRSQLSLSFNNFAWQLATSPAAESRDGKQAIQLATKACELTEYKEARYVDTLAGAYAEAGDFDAAVKWSEKSLDLIKDDKDSQLKEILSRALETYKAKKPMRIPAAESAAETTTEQSNSSKTVVPISEETAKGKPEPAG